MRVSHAVAAVLVASAALPAPAFAKGGAESGSSGSAAPASFGFVGRYATGLPGTSAETTALDGDRLYVSNADNGSVDIVDVADPAVPVRLARLDLRSLAGLGPEASVASVTARDGVLAVAVAADPKIEPGKVLVLDRDGQPVGWAPVGTNPDALTFTPDGRRILVANEGEPSSYLLGPAGDPEGSVSIITLPPGQAKGAGNRQAALPVRTVGFTDFNVGGPRHGELPAGVRIFGPNATVAQDLEPEYVAVSPDGRTAYVTLQENNAIAVIELPSGRLRAITALGFQDHGTVPLDASDQDGVINIRTWANVRGMYQPDQAAAFQVNGRTYLLTANEGDSRTDWPGLNEEARARTVTTDATFPNRANTQVGRLTVTTSVPASPAPQRTLYAFGSRSFSIWDDDVRQVWDSKDQLERLVAAANPSFFNSNNDANNFDNRSDNKGPEPEGALTAVIDGRTYGFVGLERQGGVVVADLSDPTAPVILQYLQTRVFSGPSAGPDSGPEGIAFDVSGPDGRPLLAVGNEVTGTVTLFTTD
jgi:DNA-binding beta-propeller fold protein YncE